MTDEVSVRSDLESLFRIVALFASKCGFGTTDIRSMVDTVIGHLPEDVRGLDGELLIGTEQKDFLASMLGLWSRHPDYVDAMGKPKAIAAAGARPSLQSLYDDAIAANVQLKRPVGYDNALRLLVEHEALSDCGEDYYEPTGVGFPINKNSNAAAMARVGLLLEYAQTNLYNVDKPRGSGRFQTVAAVNGFPEELIPIVDAMLRDEGMTFIEAVDEFLVKARTEHLDSNAKTKRVGIGVYRFEMDND